MGPSRRQLVLMAVILGVVTFLLFMRVGSYPFITYDDDDYVVHNEIVQKGLTAKGLRWAFNIGYTSNWHPVTWFSHMLDCQLFGMDAGKHHLTSALFHSLNAVLLFFVLQMASGHVRRSFVIAALFAWHPLHVESVAWVSERKDVLSTFFGLLTIGAYVHHVKGAPKRWLWIALGFFALGLGSKPMLVTLPCVLLLMDFWPLNRLPIDALFREGGRRQFRRLALEKAWFFGLSAISCLLTVMAQKFALQSFERTSVWDRVSNAAVSYATYLFKAFCPVNLSIFYPYNHNLAWWQWGGAMVVLGLVTFVAMRTLRSAPWIMMGWLWYLGMLVPVIGFLQVGYQSMADRYTYVPVVGVFVMVVWSAAEWLVRRPRLWRTGIAATGLALLAYMGLTCVQLGYWRNDIVLFEHALKVTPDNAQARHSLGFSHVRAGHPEIGKVYFAQAIKLDPKFPGPYCALGTLAINEGRAADAVPLYLTAYQLEPWDAGVMWNTGVALILAGDVDHGLKLVQEASTRRPEDAQGRYDIAMELIRLKRSPEAINWLGQAIKIDPEWYEPYQILAWVAATHPDPKVRQPPLAIEAGKRACELTENKSAKALDAYAAARASAGQFSDAIKLASTAKELAESGMQTQTAAGIARRIEGYRQGRPHVDWMLVQQPPRQ